MYWILKTRANIARVRAYRNRYRANGTKRFDAAFLPHVMRGIITGPNSAGGRVKGDNPSPEHTISIQKHTEEIRQRELHTHTHTHTQRERERDAPEHKVRSGGQRLKKSNQRLEEGRAQVAVAVVAVNARLSS